MPTSMEPAGAIMDKKGHPLSCWAHGCRTLDWGPGGPERLPPSGQPPRAQEHLDGPAADGLKGLSVSVCRVGGSSS